MAAALNGMALHGGFIPYGGSFFAFSDYMRPALRLAAMMRLRVIHVLTHDGIGVGEDGPTHQPVEHLASLRAMPNIACVPPRRRDGDGRVLGTGVAPRPTGPSLLVLSRQALAAAAHGCRREPLRPRRLRAGGGRRAAAGDADRHRLGSRHRDGGARQLLARGGSRSPWSRCRAGSCSRSRTSATAPTCSGGAARVGIEAACGFGWERWLGDGRRVHRHDRLRRLRARTPTCTGNSASRRRPSPPRSDGALLPN